ncbi:MAG: hypothetical protein AAFP70_22785 [Calditrichota bacterium]
MIILLIAALTVAHFLTPYWWWIIPLPLAYGFLESTGGLKAFASGAFSCALVWLAAAFYYAQDASVLMPKIDTLVGAQTGGLQYIAIGLIAFTCGGIACACGYFLRDALEDDTGEPTGEVAD